MRMQNCAVATALDRSVWSACADNRNSTHAQLDVDAINAAEERGLPEDNIIVARDSQFARRVANRG